MQGFKKLRRNTIKILIGDDKMLYPSINELLEKVDSRYTLVVVAAKRARQIIDEGKSNSNSCFKKPVSIATQEIFEEKILYKREKEPK